MASSIDTYREQILSAEQSLIRQAIYQARIVGIKGLYVAAKKKFLRSDELISIELASLRSPLFLRPNTSDVSVFEQVFVRCEYAFMTRAEPSFIVDAGANIGLAAVYFASRFPNATIVSIEPELSNFQLLQRNVAPYPNVIPLQAALWGTTEQISLRDEGLGNAGFVTVSEGAEGSGRVLHRVNGVTVDSVMRQFGVKKIDILKIDIEGAEKEVFEAAETWIDAVDAVIIELHERMKRGCNRAFYAGTPGFDHEWQQGENVYLARASAAVTGR